MKIIRIWNSAVKISQSDTKLTIAKAISLHDARHTSNGNNNRRILITKSNSARFVQAQISTSNYLSSDAVPSKAKNKRSQCTRNWLDDDNCKSNLIGAKPNVSVLK